MQDTPHPDEFPRLTDSAFPLEGLVVSTLRTLAVAFLVVSGLLLIPIESSAVKKRKPRTLTRAESKQAELRLREMGYPTGPIDGAIDEKTQSGLVLFQKWEGLKLTGRLSRSDFEAIMNAEAPQ